MATIDLIVLGMLRKQPLSAYEIQKLVEYRNVSKWVKISTPSIYKKVIHLEEKGFLKSVSVRENNMPEKAVYSLTSRGEAEFERLMLEIAGQPVRIFLDFNAVIDNLDSLPPEKQKVCLADIDRQVKEMKSYMEENMRRKVHAPETPEIGIMILRQQLALAETIEKWLDDVREKFA